MKAKRFKPGQEVVCVKQGTWHYPSGRISKAVVPAFNEVCVVEGYKAYNTKMQQWTIYLEGFGDHGYGESNFEPLIETSVLEKELNSISETVTL